ncbi:Endoplasmic reticulum oxidoreductin-2 [Glycine soja]
MLATIMADIMVTKEIEDTALRLCVDLSTLDLDAIRLPPGEDCGLLSHLFSCLQPLEQLEMVRDPLDLRRYAKTEDGDDLTQALVEEIIEKCLGFEVEQRSLVIGYWSCSYHSYQELCQEEKILYKLISGLHSSISIHIAFDYLLDEATNLWGQNLTLMYDRVLRYPDHVRNLYFTFLFVLRAVTKLLYNPKLQAACPIPFDEANLWKGQSGPELKQKIQQQFRNISALMDCVG